MRRIIGLYLLGVLVCSVSWAQSNQASPDARLLRSEKVLRYTYDGKTIIEVIEHTRPLSTKVRSLSSTRLQESRQLVSASRSGRTSAPFETRLVSIAHIQTMRKRETRKESSWLRPAWSGSCTAKGTRLRKRITLLVNRSSRPEASWVSLDTRSRRQSFRAQRSGIIISPRQGNLWVTASVSERSW
jgi:hypothetical protein